MSDVRDLLDAELDRASYPIREVETLSETDTQVELTAVLVPTTADNAELDAVAAALGSFAPGALGHLVGGSHVIAGVALRLSLAFPCPTAPTRPNRHRAGDEQRR